MEESHNLDETLSYLDDGALHMYETTASVLEEVRSLSEIGEKKR